MKDPTLIITVTFKHNQLAVEIEKTMACGLTPEEAIEILRTRISAWITFNALSMPSDQQGNTPNVQ